MQYENLKVHNLTLKISIISKMENIIKIIIDDICYDKIIKILITLIINIINILIEE